MLVEGRSLRQREPGRRSRSGWRSRPDGYAFCFKRMPPAVITSVEGAGSASMACVAASALDYRGHVGPGLLQPGNRFRPVRAAFVGREGGVFQRLQPKPVRGVVDQFMQALVAGALLQTIGDPRARPFLPGDVHDAGRIGLLEPRRRIKLDRQPIVDRMACAADHWSRPTMCSTRRAASSAIAEIVPDLRVVAKSRPAK